MYIFYIIDLYQSKEIVFNCRNFVMPIQLHSAHLLSRFEFFSTFFNEFHLIISIDQNFYIEIKVSLIQS